MFVLYFIKGAVISSTATPDKNKLNTGTLTYSDIQNKAEYKSTGFGVGYNNKLEPGMKLGDYGFTPNPSIPVGDSADSITKAAISPGTITIRDNPNQDISTLSRDTANSLNALGKIFDKQSVKERQELASLFGELAFEEIHNLGLKDGDPRKVVLHTIVGTIMGKLGGNAFSGGFSAGLNEALQTELAKITDPDLRQWASYIIGRAAGDMVGGATAVYSTKYNNLFYDVADWIIEKKYDLKVNNIKGMLRLQGITPDNPNYDEIVCQMLTELDKWEGTIIESGAKVDIKQIKAVANLLDMTPTERRLFGDFVEEYKRDSGIRGNFHFPWQKLVELGKLFKGGK